MDTKEEGEISLDDVSSSEETNHNNWLKKEKKLDMDRKYDKRVEVDILPQDAVYGKENRQYSNELHPFNIKSKPPPFNDLPKDGLLPISSEEELTISPEKLSNGTNQLIITNPGKRKKRKKKKKKTGQRLLVLDDLESAIEPPTMPTRITGDDIVSPLSHYDSSELHNKYSPPSAKHYRSPVNHCKTNSHHPRTLSPRRRSPRRLSPERSNLIADRHLPHKSSREHSFRHDDKYKLLKKLRQLDNRHEKDPMKDQSFNRAYILKSNSDSYLKENGHLENHRRMIYDVEDEEDVDKLRRAALETQLQKNDRKDIEVIKDSKTESEDNSSLNYNVGDQDEEDLELRMIALRSAFQNKHRDRIQRGIANKNRDTNKRDKSPSSDSLIDDLFNDFNKESIAAEGVNVEDMDLDSDVEREKENQPYSPTDGLSDDKYSDTEAIESQNKVPLNSYPSILRTEYHAPVPTYSQEFYPQPNRMAHHESTYPPSDTIHSSTIDKYLTTDQFNYNASYIRSIPLRTETIPAGSRVEAPYSPTDTPAFDPELPVCPSELSFVDNVTNNNSVSYPNSSYLNNPMLRPHNNGPNYISPRMELNKPAVTPTTSHFIRDPRRAAALSRGLISISTQPQKTILPEQSSMKPVEKSKEVVNTDPRLHGILSASKHKPDERFDEIIKSLAEYNSEPAYLQGVPDVTKDANKIPILVNRTLVPASILKTNKQLQQKLLTKKSEDTTEKTFKNAEMQSVEITKEPTSTSTFRPIKLPIKTRKIQLIDVPIKGFDPMNESSTSVDKALGNSSAVDLSKNTETLTTEVDGKKRGKGRPKTPTIRKTNAKKSPIKDSSKTLIKSIERRSKENNKEVVNPLEEKGKTDEGEAKKSRGRPRSKSVYKLDKNDEENKKRETIHRTAKDKTSRISEISSKENDKIRRSSVDEDEEALRASVLASMYTSGIKKTRDDIIDKTKTDNTKDKSLITSGILNDKTTSIPTSKNNPTIINTIKSMFINNKNSTAKNTATNASNTLINTRKRPGIADVFGPPEKVLKKKTTINSKNPLDNLTKYLAAPASPKMSKNVSRVVINLGEDTDSESDVSDYCSSSPSKKLNVSYDSLADFDKKVDEFLKSQREKLEVNSKVISTPKGNKTTTAASVTQKTSVLGSTPLAVRHLPVSKQEEYRRLKQQLAEKEKQKLIRASKKSLPKLTKVPSQSTEKHDQVTPTNLQVKKTMSSSQSAVASSISTSSSLSNNQKVFTNIPQSSKTTSSFSLASENLHPLTNIYPNNLMDMSLTEELMLPLDFTIKPDPDDFLTITDEPKVDPLIIASVSQNCSDEINYDMPLKNLGLRENLVIQISNIQEDSITGQRKVIFAKDLAFTEETTPYVSPKEATLNTPCTSGLKILTTAQLNMKIQQETPATSLEEMEEKVRLDENEKVITPNTQPLIEHNNLTGDLLNQDSPIIPKPEPMSDSFEQFMPISSIQITSPTELNITAPAQVNINTTESVPLLLLKEEPEIGPPTQSETVIPMNVIKCEVEEHLETYNKLPLEEQKTELSKIENDLIKKRYNVLSDITEMMENLQRWDKEQNIRIKLAADIAKLRLELKTVEERFEEQTLKVSNMGPKIRKAHSTINSGRSECVKLIKLCEGLGTSISGDEYKTPDIGANALTNKLRDISDYTQQLFTKKKALNKQNHHMGLISPIVHKNVCQSNSVGIVSTNEQQSVPLNLSVQSTSEVNKNLSTVKTEEFENQDFNSAPTTTPILDNHSTLVTNSTSIINFSSVTEFTSNNNSQLPVQPNVSVNISQNQITSDEFSLSKVKSEPVDVNETEGLENTPMEVDNESETIKDTQFTQVAAELISKIRIEKTDNEEINENISIFNNTALKQEENDTQLKECYENTSNFIERRVKNKIKEDNGESINEQPSNYVGVNNKTSELNLNSEIFEIEKRLENDQIQNTEVYSVLDNLLINKLENGQVQNERIKCETDCLLSSELRTNDMNIVEQISERGTEAIVNMTQETWAEFEEEKFSVTGVPYESVLTAFNTTRPVDPNGVLCPFELMGTCKDDSCTYNHLNADRKT